MTWGYLIVIVLSTTGGFLIGVGYERSILMERILDHAVELDRIAEEQRQRLEGHESLVDYKVDHPL